MIYLFLPETEMRSANDFCKATFHDEGDTFVANFKNDNSDKVYCMASIPDNKSSFATAIVKQFGCFVKDPRGNSQFSPRNEGDAVLKDKFGSLEKLNLTSFSPVKAVVVEEKELDVIT